MKDREEIKEGGKEGRMEGGKEGRRKGRKEGKGVCQGRVSGILCKHVVQGALSDTPLLMPLPISSPFFLP